MKILNGRELAGYIKERQAHEIRSLRGKKIFPRLVILRDSSSPVITKYVELKKRYGSDIGVSVEDRFCAGFSELSCALTSANSDPSVSGIIVQLPLKSMDSADKSMGSADKSMGSADKSMGSADELLSQIIETKDVDGLSGKTDTATATAINWLLAGYNIELERPTKIAIVGRGRLVGAPLFRMFENSGYDVKMFHRGDDLNELKNFNVVISATGSPRLIKSEYISPGTALIDAGTASENGVLIGDIDDSVRARTDLSAITPKIGGVGPLTVSALFDAVINSAKTA